MTDATVLSLLLLLPAATALLAWILPAKPGLQKTVSVTSSALMLAFATFLLWTCIASHRPGFVLRERIEILPSWGLSWHLGLDGLSGAMVFLAALVQFCAAVSTNPTARPRTFHALFQLLFVGVYGSFLALDMVFFYVFWELMLVPMFLLVAVWGGDDRKRAAVKFFLYTMGGSMALLLCILMLRTAIPVQGVLVEVRPAEAAEQVAVDALGRASLYDLPLLAPDSTGRFGPVAAAAVVSGQETRLVVPVRRSFDVLQWRLLAPFWSHATVAGLALAPLGLFLLFVAFAVKVPSFPLHAWLPHAHVQAPTSISVVLAGILLKLGVYGLLRVAWPLFPGAIADHAALLGWIGAISVVWGGFAALGQSDLKRLVAYSSISHMGFCVLGMASASAQGISGAAYQCVAHGLSASLLFLLVGAIYDRAHHRRVDGFGGLAQLMPKFSFLFLFSAMVGAGLPGLAGFIGEISALLGAWTTEGTRIPGWIAASGVVLSAAYLLWTVQRLLYGPVRHPEQKAFADLSATELVALVPLAALSLLLGVWPGLLQAATGPVSASLASHMAWVQNLR
jgi:NADH-quinone oxidoreductase subunit M